MSAKRARNVLIAAFAISLLLHLILAGYLRWPFNTSASEEEVIKVRHITIARIIPRTPPPPPPPSPTPAPTPHATPAVKATIIPPHTTPRAPNGPQISHVTPAVPGKTAAPAATPKATPSPAPIAQACLQHDISPAVSATADPIEIPPEVRALKKSGTAAIQVQLDPQGNVTNATIAQSSGNPGLDEVATQMAKSATYTPALTKCKPVASTYTFTVQFSAW